MSHEIVNEIMGLMARHVLNEILNEVREASLYSLIADEASDVAHKEQICVSIRWMDSSLSTHESPVELIHAPSTDSSTLTMIITDCLLRLALPIAQCRGQAYDGPSNMSGITRGVAARIQEIELLAIYDCTNLNLPTVGKQSTVVRDALECRCSDGRLWILRFKCLLE